MTFARKLVPPSLSQHESKLLFLRLSEPSLTVYYILGLSLIPVRCLSAKVWGREAGHWREQKWETAQKSHGVHQFALAFLPHLSHHHPHPKNLTFLLSWVWPLIRIHCSEKGRDTILRRKDSYVRPLI